MNVWIVIWDADGTLNAYPYDSLEKAEQSVIEEMQYDFDNYGKDYDNPVRPTTFEEAKAFCAEHNWALDFEIVAREVQ